MELLGQDAFGTWLWSRPSDRGPGADYDSFLTLVPLDRWWTATWIRHRGAENKLWFDITTPAVWHSAHLVTIVDLEIDVQRFPDGTIEVLDEEEFAERADEWGYPPEVIDAATESAESIVASLRKGDEPFDRVAATWLRTAMSSV
ncbi:MAG: DUF402 domain-containing protein [Acidimicrobiales bacterium]|nr:DUF402 domain-containing protein [Acidimicrobiales bacterium]